MLTINQQIIDNFVAKINNKANSIHEHTYYSYIDGDEIVIIQDDEKEYIDKTVSIAWDDNNNALGYRPRFLTCILSNGIKTILSEDNEWTNTISVSKYDTNNNEITYTWTVSTIAGYRLTNTSVSGNETTFTFNMSTRPPTPGTEPIVFE